MVCVVTPRRETQKKHTLVRPTAVSRLNRNDLRLTCSFALAKLETQTYAEFAGTAKALFCQIPTAKRRHEVGVT
jgi:hypothetical protein